MTSVLNDLAEGVEAARRRPGLFLDEPTRTAFLAAIVRNLLDDTPPPTAVRIVLWRDGVLTIGFDGEPLPVEVDPRSGRSRLYDLFLSLSMHNNPPRTFGGGVINALSERLVVSTVHGGTRYRAAFARGGLVGFLSKYALDERFGSTWFTLSPDPAVLSGALTIEDVAAIASRAAAMVPVTVSDRSSEQPEWW